MTHFVVETSQIEAGPFCVPVQMDGVKMQLILEQQLVELPKPVLRARRLSGLRHEFGMWVNLGHRKVAKNEAHAVAELCAQQINEVAGLRARRAFGAGPGRRE